MSQPIINYTDYEQYNNHIFVSKMQIIHFDKINGQTTKRKNNLFSSTFQKRTTKILQSQSAEYNIYQQLHRLTKVMDTLIKVAYSQKQVQNNNLKKKNRSHFRQSSQKSNTKQNQSKIMEKQEVNIKSQLKELYSAFVALNMKINLYQEQIQHLNYQLKQLQGQNLELKSMYQSWKFIFNEKKQKEKNINTKASHLTYKNKDSIISSKLQQSIKFFEEKLYNSGKVETNQFFCKTPTNKRSQYANTPNFLSKASYSSTKKKFQELEEIVSVGKTQFDYSDIFDNECIQSQQPINLGQLIQAIKKNTFMSKRQNKAQYIKTDQKNISEAIRIICQKIKQRAKQQYIENIYNMLDSSTRGRQNANTREAQL